MTPTVVLQALDDSLGSLVVGEELGFCFGSTVGARGQYRVCLSYIGRGQRGKSKNHSYLEIMDSHWLR